jgi:hypothetical protein
MRDTYINPAIANAIKKLKEEGYSAIPYEFYHYRSFNAGNLPTKMEFFHQVIGDTDGSLTLTEEDTNMDRKSEFSYPFIAQYLCAKVLPAVNREAFIEEIDTNAPEYDIKRALVNDILKIYNRGILRISVQNKEIIKITPLQRIPAGAGVSGSIAISSSNASSSRIYLGGLLINGENSRKNKFPIEIFFDTNIKFSFTLEYLRGTISIYNPLRIGFVLEGILFRK